MNLVVLSGFLTVAIPYKSGKYSYLYDKAIRPYVKEETVAIPYKSGKYSYIFIWMVLGIIVFFMSQSLINQGNILTY